MPRAPKSHKPAAAAAAAPYPAPNPQPNPADTPRGAGKDNTSDATPSSPKTAVSAPTTQTAASAPQPSVQQPIAISSLLNHPAPGSSSQAGPSSRSEAASKPKGRGKNDPLPWLTVELPALPGPEGEMYIPIYDDCNEIRRKIRAFFSNNNTEYKCTQKYFLEAIGNVNSNSYRRFMAASGEGGGAENGTYTGSYVFFEKKRVWEGKPKGKKRLDAEALYPEGRDLVDSNRPVWVTTRMW